MLSVHVSPGFLLAGFETQLPRNVAALSAVTLESLGDHSASRLVPSLLNLASETMVFFLKFRILI
jgi:hypothetical protein